MDTKKTSIELCISDNTKNIPTQEIPDDITLLQGSNKDEINNNLQKYIFDFSNDINIILKALLHFYDINKEETVEVINRLCQMYVFSGSKILQTVLFKICTQENTKILPSIYRLECAKSLCQGRNNDIGYIALDSVCKHFHDIPTPIRIEAIFILVKSEKFKNNAITYFTTIISDQNIECDFRYKTILSSENKDITLLKEASLLFLTDTKNMTQYRILAAQLLLVKKLTDFQNIKDPKTIIENTLLSFSKDNDLDYNLRADAADVLLRFCDNTSPTFLEAREIIILLGRQTTDVKTVFDNAQNVHVKEIEDSITQAVEFLSGIDIMTIPYTESETPDKNKEMPITFEYLKKQIITLTESKYGKKSTPETDKINISLNRIYMDRALYSKYNCSLINILLKVWSYLSSHESVDDMKNRLLEELIEMSGTCSSGFASRLVNVISGFGDFNITISWKDQIIANFSGRLNARINNIQNLKMDEKQLKQIYYLMFYEYQDKKSKIRDQSMDEFCKDKDDINEDIIKEEYQSRILLEMLIPVTSYNKRKSFLNFFRDNLSSIRDELFQEFSGLIADTDFDLWFRSAISTYEGF